MIIPLEIVDDSIFLTTTIHAPHIAGRVSFMIDTGSPISFISGIDAPKLQIPRKIEKGEKIFWADKEFKLGKISNVDLWVLATDSGKDTLKILKLPYLSVTFDFIHVKQTMDSPNILGMDFIIKQQLRLVVDGQEKKAYFEM
jgi:hypothetical protein